MQWYNQISICASPIYNTWLCSRGFMMLRILKVIDAGVALLLHDLFSAPYAVIAISGGLFCTALFYIPVSKYFPLVHQHYYYRYLFWITNGFIASITTAAFRLVIPYGFVITGFIKVFALIFLCVYDSIRKLILTDAI